MASVLSFPPFVPFQGTDHGPLLHRSISSLKSRRSEGFNGYHGQRFLSTTSLISKPSHSAASARLSLSGSHSTPQSQSGTHDHSPARRSISSILSTPHSLVPSTLSESEAQALRYSGSFNFDQFPQAVLESGDDVSIDSVSLVDGKDGTSEDEEWHESPETPPVIGTPDVIDFASEPAEQQDHLQTQTFRRWVSTLRRRNANLQTPAKSPCLRRAIHSMERSQGSDRSDELIAHHRHSGSHVSSIAFVTGVRSASMTMTSTSLPSINAPASARSPRSIMYVMSNPNSRSDLRTSLDSDNGGSIPAIDEAAFRRSQKRARKVQELVRTEGGYLADLKALHHAYCTLLLPVQSVKRAAIQACISDVVQLHEEVLAELQPLLEQLIPCGSSRQLHQHTVTRPRLHTAAGRLDALSPERVYDNPRRFRKSLEATRASLSNGLEHLCAPQLAAQVAQVFVTKAKRFTVYEEYGARCEIMQFEVDMRRSSSPSLDHDRALEALQATICSTRDKTGTIKKALGLKDLLIKPIQRATRYELLFKDLLSLTPCGDDPVSHSTLDDALFVISQTCHDLNKASGNPERLRAFNSHRLLQERLLFEKKDAIETMFHQFGKLLLCGTLYFAYRGTTNIRGQYAITILYESCIVIASATSSSKYHVSLVIPLSTSAIEEPDNGKALQCHTTPHTWKLTFESEGALFEILSVACSKAEADVWRGQISGRIAVEKQYLNEGRSQIIDIRSPLTDEMRSVGKAYGRACDFRRRASVQRAATLGPLTELDQVIIKNTQAAGKENDSSVLVLPIPRSQSVITPSHIPVLAPRRSDRIHLEAILMDVWTKDTLPFPGLGSKRGEYSMRASAGHVIRKLSMASITSNFSKRSMSYTSISQASLMDDRSFRTRPRIPVADKVPKKPSEKKIDFHSAPEAFLPEDFDLKATSRARGRLAGLRTLTMGIERPKTPFFPSENLDPGRIKRSRSIITRRRSGSEDLTDRLGKDQTATVATSKVTAMPMQVSPGCSSKSPASQEGRPGVRQRARSRLAKLLA